MRALSFLRSTVCILPLLLAPETGGAGGSEAPAAVETCPAVTGDTLEAKVQNGAGIITSLWGKLTAALSNLTKSQSDYNTLEGQFTALKENAQTEKDEHAKTKSALETEKGEHTKSKASLDLATKNVERLESLCDLRGVDRNAALQAPAGPVVDARAALVKQLEAATDSRERGQIANQLREFDLKAKQKKD